MNYQPILSCLFLFVADIPAAEVPELPGGLVAAYTFERNTCVLSKDGKPQFSSSPKNSHPAELIGSVPAKGRAGIGIEFANQGGLRVRAETMLGTTESFTVAAWIKVKQFEGSNYVVAREDWNEGSRGFVLRLRSSGEPEFSIGDGSNWHKVRGKPISTGDWHHLVATCEPGKIGLVINGGKRIEEALGESMVASPFDFGIGRSTFDGRRGFHGIIDEVGIWDRVLSAKEMREVYNRGKAEECRSACDRFLTEPDRHVASSDSRTAGIAHRRLSNEVITAVCGS